MAVYLRRSRWRVYPPRRTTVPGWRRSLRSDAALEAIAKAGAVRTPCLALYNYPSFSGAFSALFAHLFHSRLNLPCLILPFSSVVPLRVDDLAFDGLKRCYFLDFIGPRGFALELSRRTASEIICFDHRKSVLRAMPSAEVCTDKVTFRVDLDKSSSTAAYEYFMSEPELVKSVDGTGVDNKLLDQKDRDRVELVLKYIEDGDLRQWRMPHIRAFNMGIRDWTSNMNCISNPRLFEQVSMMIHYSILNASGHIIYIPLVFIVFSHFMITNLISILL
ncbi:hypothetical protein Dimus_003017 [Dionaea muscipula]